MLAHQPIQEKVMGKGVDVVSGSPLSAIASFPSEKFPKAKGAVGCQSSSDILKRSSTANRALHIAGPPSCNHQGVGLAAQDCSNFDSVPDTSDTDEAQSSVLSKYMQKFQEEDPQGVWKIGRARSSPGPGIRRHLSMPQLPRLNEEGHEPQWMQEYDSADSSCGSAENPSSTKSCPASPHQLAMDEKPYLWQRRQKFSNSLSGIKVLSDFYNPSQFHSPHSSISTPSGARSICPSSFAVARDEVSLEAAEGEDRFGVKYHGKYKGMDTTARILRIKVGVDVPVEEGRELLGELMSSLRHPNLELHVGHTPVVDHTSQLMTLSEHLPHSLVDTCPAIHRKGHRQAMPMAHRWALEMFRGMTYLHTGVPPVAICDLHPQDLRLDADLHLKIVDVGLRTALRRRGLDSETDSISVYTAPELIAGGKQARQPAADMYSCGMVLWFLYHGVEPTRSEEGGRMPPCDKMREQELVSLLQACWEGPDDRPSSQDCIVRMEAIKAREDGRDGRGGALRSPSGFPGRSPRGCCVQ